MSEEFTAPETGAEETVAPEPQAETPAIEAEAPAETPAEDAPQEKKPDRISMRFSELAKARDAAKQEAEYWRQQALNTQQPQNPAQDFSDNPYSPEAIKATVQQALAEERRQQAERDAYTAQAEKAKGLQAKLYESGLEGAVLIASGADIPFTPAMIDALAVSEQAPLIAHHLGTNIAEAARIARLPPQLQGYELAKLESRLASQPKTTNAPPPPSTVGTRGNPGPGLRDDMNTDDWIKARNQQVAGQPKRPF